MISIIIPAHNEARVIGRCLGALLDEAPPGELEVIVVCNGCRDRTAEVARSFGDAVTVIETDVPSKANALNLGDRAASGFPRIYLDADIVLSLEAIRQTAAALREPGVLTAAPLMNVDVRDRPWSVRAFYQVWLSLPYCREGMVGSGVYALSEEGRRRFEEFPRATADDLFVRLHFAASERRTVTSCTFTITPPRTLGGVIDIKTRAQFGNEELKRLFPHIWRNENARHGQPLLRLALRPLSWPALAVYTFVKFAVRYRAWKRLQRGEISKWERDESSREAAPEHVSSA